MTNVADSPAWTMALLAVTALDACHKKPEPATATDGPAGR